MTCREVGDFLLEYASGELPPCTRERFEDHLSRCPNCREYLAQYLAAIRFGRRAFDDEACQAIGGGIPVELVGAILAARPH